MADSYASLPGTSTSGFVQHNLTPMKSKLSTGPQLPGCHPSRWIYELLSNNFTTCDLFERARQADLDVPFDWQHQHRLVLNGNQSFTASNRKVLSAICLDCHFHFVFKIFWDETHARDRCNASKACWPMKETAFPWHHLVWGGSQPDHKIAIERTKYYPLRAREYFACNAAPCTLQVTLDVSDPRMGAWWVQLLMDEDAILSDLMRAKEQEPSRYEGATEDWATQAPLNLNTYLKNLLESDPESVRSISKRNKRFAVIFGPRCFEIFRTLEFQESESINDGVDEGVFTPVVPQPSISPSGETEIGSYRGYLEDVRSEVQCLIHKAGQPGEGPSFVNARLHADLGCVEVPNVAENHLVNIGRYKLLGVLPDQPREVYVNAYFRQWEVLPNQKREMVEALMGVANDCNDQQLSDFAMTQSSVFDSQLEVQGNADDEGLVNEALIWLGLSPPNTYAVTHIIDAFRQKLVDEPGEATTARTMVMMIAQAATNDEYQTKLVMEGDQRMTVETSKVVLSGNQWDISDWCSAAESKIKAAKSKDAKLLYLNALESIADQSGDPKFKNDATTLLNLHSAKDAGIDEAMTEESSGPADRSLPVGLHNIGNTCYLNSLLQYLYTVKPVREIIHDWSNLRLELSDESIQQRRIGGNMMRMDRGEAVVAQAFVTELAELFDQLHTSDKKAVRPSQRLANAVLLSTHSLLEHSKKASQDDSKANATHDSKSATSEIRSDAKQDLDKEGQTGPRPPPLPARPSPEPTAALLEQSPMDVEMTEGVDPTRTSEASSIGSSSTLIDLNDTPNEPPPSYEEVEAASFATDEKDPRPGQAKQDDGKRSSPVAPDVSMTDAPHEPQSIDDKVLEALKHQTRSSGTDQQDVEEVIGSIISRLQAAIRPSHVDQETGIQLEKIIETFFVTTVNYTKKFDEGQYQHEISYDRSITAFPAPDGICSLYDALGRNFDRQVLEESRLSRYTAIRNLPPILHVLIQRTQSTGRKNANPVIIPETLYLDRYMDCPHDSPEFQRRVQEWVTASHLSDLQLHKLEADFFSRGGGLLDQLVKRELGDSGDSGLGESDDRPDIAFGNEEDWNFDGPVDADFLLVSSKRRDEKTSAQESGKSAPVGELGGFAEVEDTVRQMLAQEVEERQRTLNEYYDKSKKHAYRLEAVICHRGMLHAGHYWVWIHDFEENLWRCYNDASIEVERDTEKVLRDLSNGGEPYYLCYVRDEDKDRWVDVPKRQVPETPELTEDEGNKTADTSHDSGLTANLGTSDAAQIEAKN